MTNRSSAVQTVELDVQGMTCGSCERRIRDALGQVAGYRDARVSRAEGKVSIDYDGSAAAVGDLLQAVVRAGYPAELASAVPAAPARAGCSCCAPQTL